MKNELKRVGIALVVSLILVGIVASLGLSNGRRTDGVYYEASGIHPDAELIEVNGEIITAEEYFYWLDYVCGYLTASAGGKLDLSKPLNENATYADYAKMDALNTVMLRASISSWAKEAGIELTDKDNEALEAQRQEYMKYYGGEEGYRQQLQILGISEEMLLHIESAPLVYTHVQEAFCDPKGALYPGDEAVEAYAQQGGYVTARLLYFATNGMDEKAVDDVKDKAESYAKRLSKAKDTDKTYEKLAKELELNTDPKGLTIHPGTSDPAVCTAIAKLKVGQVSGVIQGQSGFYVAVRMPLDKDSVSVDLYNSALQTRTESVKMNINRSLYQQIDAAEFYQNLTKARSALHQELADNGNKNS